MGALNNMHDNLCLILIATSVDPKNMEGILHSVFKNLTSSILFVFESLIESRQSNLTS